MIPTDSAFTRFAHEYDRWFDENPDIFTAQLDGLRGILPKSGLGLDTGTGSGRFASRLGIRHGIDPASVLLRMAGERGVETVRGCGEYLPYRNNTFDYILMMTVICFLEDLEAACREAFRVLKPGGVLVIGFIERDSEIARRKPGKFLRHARFRSMEEVRLALETSGFSPGSLKEFCGVSVLVVHREHPDELF